MQTSATPRQIGFIHGLAAKAGLDEDTRRDFLERETGRRSCKEITAAQADAVIRKLQSQHAGKVQGLDTPLGRKLRALWITGHQLGLVRDRSDRAMLAFVERQTGVSHPRFLAEPGQGSAAVEGLKRWLTRDGGVQWLAKPLLYSDHRRPVLAAQWRKLIELGVVTPGQPIEDPMMRALSSADANGWELEAPSDYDRTARDLGKLIRRALVKREAHS